MINPAELRLGNLINVPASGRIIQFCEVVSINEDLIRARVKQEVSRPLFVECKCEDALPIELTGGLLEKVGFELSYSGTGYEFGDMPGKWVRLDKLQVGDDSKEWDVWDDGHYHLTTVRYFHALQNLIHALTGHELSIDIKELQPLP